MVNNIHHSLISAAHPSVVSYSLKPEQNGWHCANIIFKLSFLDENCFIILTASTKFKGGVYWFHVVRPSVCSSIRLWTEWCLLCNFHNTSRIHFIFTHLIKQLQKVCHVLSFFAKFQQLNFWKKFQICIFEFVLVWLGIWYESIVWVIMGWRGIFRTHVFWWF